MFTSIWLNILIGVSVLTQTYGSVVGVYHGLEESYKRCYKSLGSVTWFDRESQKMFQVMLKCNIAWMRVTGVVTIHVRVQHDLKEFWETSLAWRSHGLCYKACENIAWMSHWRLYSDTIQCSLKWRVTKRVTAMKECNMTWRSYWQCYMPDGSVMWLDGNLQECLWYDMRV